MLLTNKTVKKHEMNKFETHIPKNAPRFGNGFSRFLGRVLLKLMGYKIKGKFPDEKKLVIIAAPHTSNWDLALALGTIMALGVRINYMMKKEAFKSPLGGLFKALGGVPIDRSKPKAVILQTIKSFRDNDKFWLAILPEGTRKPVKSWKPGFMLIAKKANVPIFILGVDSRTKTLHLDRLVRKDETIEDLRLYTKNRYYGIKPKNN